MSNLNLPSLSYKSLTDMDIRDGERRKLAYETTAETMGSETGPVFIIRHHGHAIAEIGIWSVDVSNCGWGSSTNWQRLTKVLRDNIVGIPVAVRQSKGEQLLTWFKSSFNFGQASFRMVAGAWTMTSVTA